MEPLPMIDHKASFFESLGCVYRPTAKAFVAWHSFEQPVVYSHKEVVFGASPLHRHDTQPTVHVKNTIEFVDYSRHLVFRKQLQRVFNERDIGGTLSERKRTSVPEAEIDLIACSFTK